MKSSRQSSYAWLHLATLFFVVAFLSACSGNLNPFKKDDEPTETRSAKPLEVPPDLTKPEVNPNYLPPERLAGAVQQVETQAQLQAQLNGRVAPRWQGVQRMRDGQQYWLLVSASPEQTWPLVSNFLKLRGYSIAQSEPAIGIMETDWEEIADSGTDAAASMRERLRARIEPAAEPGRTEVFLSLKTSQRLKTEGSQWQRSADDDERAIEMLNRLAQYLGASKIDDALPAARSVRSSNGVSTVAAPPEVLGAPEVVANPKAAGTEDEQQKIDERWERIEKDCALCPTR